MSERLETRRDETPLFVSVCRFNLVDHDTWTTVVRKLALTVQPLIKYPIFFVVLACVSISQVPFHYLVTLIDALEETR
jgi:hypothetical protein